MKKRTIKNCLIAALGFAVIGTAGVATSMVSANTNENTVTSLDDVSLEMMVGASIRVNESAVTGIRFSATMDLAEVEWLKENYDDVKFGTFIMPAEYVEYGGFTQEALFGGNAAYYWEGKAQGTAQYEILQMYGGMYEETGENGVTYGRVNGSILEVNEANYDRAFVGISYMELTKGETVTYKLANANDNERSILYVAQRALESEDWAETDAEYVNTKGFIDTYKAANPTAEVKYTVNKVLAQKDGSTKTVTEERTAYFDETITLDLEEEAEEFYVLDEKNSVSSGKAYAQDKLALTLYYSFKCETEELKLMHYSESSFYAVDKQADKWVFLVSGGNYVGFVIEPQYIQSLLNNGVTEVTLTFGNNSGSGFGFDGLEYPAGGTESGSGIIKFALDATADYSAGIRIRFYQHDGVGPACKSIWMTVTTKNVAETALDVFRDASYQTITYQGNNVWLVSGKITANVGYVVTKAYMENLIANGATGMVVKFENADNDGSYIDSWYMSTSQGVMSTNRGTSDIATFEKVDGGCLWTVDFSKFIDGTADWHCVIDGSKGGASFARAKEFDGVAFYLYMHKNTSGTLMPNVKVTITLTYAN